MKLAVSSQEKDSCRTSLFETESSNIGVCDTVVPPSLASADQSTPTLAPPRPEISAKKGPASNELVKGQPVFLKVETNQNEIEVGWATP